MNPSEELHAAAAKVRKTAIGTTPAPWEDRSAEGTAWPILIVGGPIPDDPTARLDTVIKVHEFIDDEVMTYADAAWIALAGPQIAEPLAAWLERAGDDLSGAEAYLARTPGEIFDPFEYCDEPDSVRAALAVARAINGGDRA